jgi:hypothetical protein
MMEPEPGMTMDQVAEEYVRLVLSLGEHDPVFVDAYNGDPAWREEEKARARTLAEIGQAATTLIQTLEVLPVPEDELSPVRHRYLATQLAAVRARSEMLSGQAYSFDDETRVLYGAVSPRLDDDHFLAIQEEIDALLPGEGPLLERVEAFRSLFAIPTDRVGELFETALGECRKRSSGYLALPAAERFTVEYVTDKPWGGYNWFQGDSYSLIQVNMDLPIQIDRAVDLGCHEGYPGHHAYNTLLEDRLVKDRGWVEYSVYALNSPQSLIAEGTANFGIEMAFPGDERSRYEREVLFPMAGLDAGEADRYYRLQELLGRMTYGSNEVARRYLDGEFTREQAIQWLIDYRLRTRERAEKDLDFIDAYRGYVINYNLGSDMVRDYIEAIGDDRDQQWAAFVELLSTPRLPGDLQ